MEYKKTYVKIAAGRFLGGSLRIFNNATYPFAEQKVREYSERHNQFASQLKLLGVSIDSVESVQANDLVADIEPHINRSDTDV